MAGKKTKIVLDADVINHFVRGGKLALLPKILPEFQFIVLDIVKKEMRGLYDFLIKWRQEMNDSTYALLLDLLEQLADMESAYLIRKNNIIRIFQLYNMIGDKKFGNENSNEKELAKNSIEINPILEIGRTDVIASVLESGIGISFLPEFVTKRGFSEGKLVYIDVVDAKFDIWKQLIYHRNKWLSNSFLALVDFIKSHEFCS